MRPASHAAARVARALTALATLTSLAVLTGCGSPSASDDDDAVGPTVSVAVQPTLVPETSTSVTVNPSVPSSGGLFDAAKALASSTCTATGDVWSFSGRLENTDTEEHAFSVGVFVTSTADSTQLGGKEVVVTVPAGGSMPVEAKAFYTGLTTGVECLTGVTVKEGD